MDTTRKLSGPRVVICPATGGLEEIELDVTRATVTSGAGSVEIELRVVHCGRWPQCRDCDRACLAGVDPSWAAEHGLLTRSRVDADGLVVDHGVPHRA